MVSNRRVLPEAVMPSMRLRTCWRFGPSAESCQAQPIEVAQQVGELYQSLPGGYNLAGAADRIVHAAGAVQNEHYVYFAALAFPGGQHLLNYVAWRHDQRGLGLVRVNTVRAIDNAIDGHAQDAGAEAILQRFLLLRVSQQEVAKKECGSFDRRRNPARLRDDKGMVAEERPFFRVDGNHRFGQYARLTVRIRHLTLVTGYHQALVHHCRAQVGWAAAKHLDRKSTRLNSSHSQIS